MPACNYISTHFRAPAAAPATEIQPQTPHSRHSLWPPMRSYGVSWASIPQAAGEPLLGLPIDLSIGSCIDRERPPQMLAKYASSADAVSAVYGRKRTSTDPFITTPLAAA